MMPGKAFETQVFNTDSAIAVHSAPVLTVTSSSSSPMGELFLRIKKNDREFVQQLPALCSAQEKLGIFLDHADPASGCTPLTSALMRDHLELAVDLLMLGADPKIADDNGCAPLALANGDSMATMVLKFIILWRKHGTPRTTGSTADRSYQPLLTQIDLHTGHTLLTWAISCRHQSLVKLLIKAGPDFRVYNRFVRTALEEACVSGSLATVSVLLDAWPTLVSDLNREYLVDAMRAAAEKNRPMVLAQLLSFFRDEFRLRQADVSDADDENPLSDIASDPLMQEEAFQMAIGIKPSPKASLEQLMRRTRDTWLLTEKESRLIGLKEIAMSRDKPVSKEIVDIIHAHAKLPADD